jgi:uncharacterized protein YqhQ
MDMSIAKKKPINQLETFEKLGIIVMVVSAAYILISYNFSNFVILLVKTFNGVLSFAFPLTTGTMYYVGING